MKPNQIASALAPIYDIIMKAKETPEKFPDGFLDRIHQAFDVVCDNFDEENGWGRPAGTKRPAQ